MSEISQPTSIKPIWPTRREQAPTKRRPPQLKDEREESEEQNKELRNGNGDRHVVDDYA